MFYVVEFESVDNRGLETAVVPDFWFSNGMCFWPPYLDTTAAVRNAEAPKSHWRKYKARIMKAFATYDLARRKIQKSEETSGLSSSGEELERSGRRKAVKRKQTPMELSVQSVSSDEDQIESPKTFHELLSLPFPPQLPSTSVTCHVSEFGGECNYTVESNSTSQPFQAEIHNNTPPITLDTPRRQQIPVQHNLNEWSITDVRNYAVESVSQIKEALKLMDAKMDVLLARTTFAQAEKPAVLSGIPYYTRDSIEKCEKDLSLSATLKDSMVSELSCIGGSTCNDTVNRIMRKMIAPELAVQYSLFGKKKKLNFSSLKFLKEVICAAAIRNKNAKTVKDVEFALQSFFRHVKHGSTELQHEVGGS